MIQSIPGRVNGFTTATGTSGAAVPLENGLGGATVEGLLLLLLLMLDDTLISAQTEFASAAAIGDEKRLIPLPAKGFDGFTEAEVVDD